MLCPHCNKQLNVSNVPRLETAERHAECYGGSSSTHICPHCRKKFGVDTSVKVIISKPYKRPDDADTTW
jgi:uncharacterized protein with PIN domain